MAASFEGWRLRVSHLYPKGWDVWIAVEPSSRPMQGRYFSAEVVGDENFRRNMARDLLRLCELSDEDWDDLHVNLECDDGRSWKMDDVWPLKVDILPGPSGEGGTRLSVGFNFKRVEEYGEGS